MILLIDNYDSFTYNLRHEIEALGYACRVARNDAITLDEIERLAPSRIVLSPGPGDPDSAGVTLDVIARFAGRIPLLGVCLGHQALGQSFGGRVSRAPRARHGELSAIRHRAEGLFRGVKPGFRATRYHSLHVERETLPACFAIDAESEDGVIMAIRHRELPAYGVQFHPESIATEEGRQILLNFLGGAARAESDARALMGAILTGELSDADIERVLLEIRARGIAASELAGFAEALRATAIPVALPGREPIVDVCGTGGDGAGTFNVSTAAAFVLAGAGVRVAKHGNRSVSSRSGSFDVLDALGVAYASTPEGVARAFGERGAAFLYAPTFHPGLARVSALRKRMGVSTAFNLLGPLVNPARPTHQLVGVNDAALVPVVAEALRAQGVARALVVHGGGTDEIALHAETETALLRDGRIERARVSAATFGLPTAGLAEVRGGDARENAARIERVLADERGPAADLVVANAGAALFLVGRAATFAEGARIARETIAGGRAAEALARLRRPL